MNTLKTRFSFQPHFKLEFPLIFEAVKIAWPLACATLASASIGCVDMHLAAKIGVHAQAAVGIGDQLIFFTVLLGTGLSIAVSSCVARSVGANDEKTANNYSKDGLFLALASGAGAALFCFFAADSLLSGIKYSDMAVNYLRICGLGNFPFVLVLVETAILRATGKSMLVLKMWAIISTGSILSSWILFECPHQPLYLRLEALAIAWDLFCFAGAIYGFRAVKGVSKEKHKKENLKELFLIGPERKKRIFELARLSAPAVMAELAWLISNFSLFWMISFMKDAELAQAAWAVNLRIEETFVSVPLIALSASAAVLSAQNLGAGRVGAARNCGIQLSVAAGVLMIAVGLALFIYGNPISAWFAESSNMSTEIQSMVCDTALLLPTMATWMILTGSMEGAGATRLVLILNSTGLLLVRLPLAWLLGIAMGMGFAGIWAAVLISRLILFLITVYAYHRNWWLRVNKNHL